MKFLERAIELAKKGMTESKGGPFGCVIVRSGEIIAEGYNEVTSNNDPTAHAEIVAIRKACTSLNTWQLTDCEVYASCEPCPMCLGAIYWARVNSVVYASTRHDAAAINFDDDFIYKEINNKMNERKISFIHYPHPKAKEVFDAWKTIESKLKY
ncbi:MAG: nucleoside deaminase [Bacteroidota bacterium]